MPFPGSAGQGLLHELQHTHTHSNIHTNDFVLLRFEFGCRLVDFSMEDGDRKSLGGQVESVTVRQKGFLLKIHVM